MIAEVLGSFVSILLLLAAMVVRPARATCPEPTRMWYVEGIPRSGVFTCKRTPTGHENDSPERPGRITSRIYCTGGSLPIVVDFRTVGCQRR